MRTPAAVRIPASSSNLGPGFDALSFALDVHLTVAVHPGVDGRHRVAPSGVDCDKMPDGAENLIVRVMERAAERRGRRLDPVRLDVHNEIPLARGMGSSSTAILAGISCYEIAAGDPLPVDEVFACAMEFEPHPDNLAAGFFGGLTVSATRPDGPPVFSKIEVAPGMIPVLVIPEFELSTEKARGVLPSSYERADAVFNVQRAALVVAAMTRGDWGLLSEAMRDRLHQPYRAPLIPGLEEALSVRPEGLMGSALSGAGPTVIAFAAPERARLVGESIAGAFAQSGVAASVLPSAIDPVGRRFLSPDPAGAS